MIVMNDDSFIEYMVKISLLVLVILVLIIEVLSSMIQNMMFALPTLGWIRIIERSLFMFLLLMIKREPLMVMVLMYVEQLQVNPCMLLSQQWT